MAKNDAASRFLAIDQEGQAATAHRLVVDRACALVRRRSDPRWRLIDIEIDIGSSSSLSDSTAPHSCDQATTVDGSVKRTARLKARNERLHTKRLQLVTALDLTIAEPPCVSDLLEVWLRSLLVKQLRKGGIDTLGDLQTRVARGGRWWRGIPAIGSTKASRLSALLELLLGAKPQAQEFPVTQVDESLARFSGRDGINRLSNPACVAVGADDSEAVRVWASQSRSPLTGRQYEREAERFMLWCAIERQKALSDAQSEDCEEYARFLSNVPDHWISRRKAARREIGWAPFRGPLSASSRELALKVIRGLFRWLVTNSYLEIDPWLQVDWSPRNAVIQAGGLSSAAWLVLDARLEELATSPTKSRLRWLCTFARCGPLRPTELLRIRRGQLQQSEQGWHVHINGKGRRNRIVWLPEAAIAATRSYFAVRGLSFERAPDDAPLVASLDCASEAITYQSMRDTLLRFARRALMESPLPEPQKRVEFTANFWLCHSRPPSQRSS